MLGLDVFLKAVAAFYLAGAAGVMMQARPRTTAQAFLVAFLLLIACNQAAEVLRTAARDLALPSATLWFRVATVFAALDPFILLYFAAIYPVRRVRAMVPWLVPAGMAAAVLAFSAVGIRAPWLPHGSMDFVLGWALYTAVAYTVVTVMFARALFAPDPPRFAIALFPALAILTIPSWNRVLHAGAALVPEWVGADSPVSAWGGPWTVLWLAVPAAGVVLGRQMARRLGPARTAQGRVVQRGMVLASVVAAFMAIWPIYVVVMEGFALRDTVTGRAIADHLFNRGGTALRLVLFGGIVATAVGRGDLFETTAPLRARASRQMAALALMPVVLATAFVGFGGGAFRYVLIVAFVAAMMFLSGSLPRVVDALGRTIYGPESASPAAPRPLVAPGAQVGGRYRVGRELGRGAQGRVFEALDRVLDRPVIIKERTAPPGVAAEWLLEEGRALAVVQHPRVARLRDAFLDGGTVYLVYDPVQGTDLGSWLESRQPSVAARTRVLGQVLQGLSVIHGARVTHGDVKPSNVLVTRHGHAVIADFGSAVREDATVLLHGDLPRSGTPRYLSPERRAGDAPGPASDVYSFGVMVRELLGDAMTDGHRSFAERCTFNDPSQRFPDARAAFSEWRSLSSPLNGTGDRNDQRL